MPTMAKCVAVLCILLTIAVGVKAQIDCFPTRDCVGLSLPVASPADCQTFFGGLSHQPSAGGDCTNFPTQFGFDPTMTSVVVDEGMSISVMAGFFEGRFGQDINVNVQLIFNDARSSDLNLLTNSFSIRSGMVPVIFIISSDSTANEANETFTLRLDYDTSLFGPDDDISSNEVNVTILDGDRVEIGLNEDDFTREESLLFIPLMILKGSGVRLANPVLFRITPLEVPRALNMGVIGDFPVENILSPDRATPPDFNTTVFEVLFPADEDEPGAIITVPAFIDIVDDDIDEASEQTFIAYLEVIDVINPDALTLGRTIARCRIFDDDEIQLGFALPRYTFFEPDVETLISNVTIIRGVNQTSEQTFEIGITASVPSGISPATNQQTGAPNADFVFGTIQPFIERTLSPMQAVIVPTFSLFIDDFAEGIEGFQLTISVTGQLPPENFPSFQLPPATSTDLFVSTIIEIIDNDFTSAGWEQLNYTVNETAGVLTPLQVCAFVTNPPLETNVPLSYQAQPGTADAADFFPNGFPLPEDPNDPFRECFNVFITGDLIAEGTESFTLLLTSTDSAVTIDPPVTEIFILDVDEAMFGFINAPYEANETDGSVLVEVSLIGATVLQREVSILLSYSDGTAQNGSDFMADEQILMFGPGTTSIPISLPLVDDDIFELTEMLQASLSFPGEAPPRVSIDPAVANITIFDDDVLLFGFDNDTYEIEEDSGPARPSVSLMSGDPGSFEVRLTVATDDSNANATAIAGLDYMSLSGFQLTYSSASAISMSFDVGIIPDELTELREFFEVIISGSSLLSGGVELSLTVQESDRIMIAIDRAQIFILDVNRARIGFRILQYNVVEGDGPVLFEFAVLNGTLAFSVDVAFFTTNGTAIAGVDYIETDSELFTLSGNDGAIAPVDLVNDTDVEGLENFFGNLEAVPGQVLDNVDFDPILATATIIDDDSVVIGFVPAEYFSMEGDGFVTFLIQVIEGVPSENIFVEFYTESGSAEAPGDYNQTVTLVMFGPSVTFAIVDVPIIADGVFENIELFYGNLRLPNGSQARVDFDPDRANATIIDADTVTIGFVRSYEVTEGLDFMVDIEIAVLEGELGRDVAIRVFTTEGSAFDPGDYMGNSEMVTFTPSQTSFNFSVGIVNNDVLEDTEIFFAEAELLSTDAAGVIIMPNVTSVTIIDDDGVTIGFSQSAYDILEGVRVVNVTIVMMGLTDIPLTLILNTQDGTAVSSSGAGDERDFMSVVNFQIVFFPSPDMRQEMVVQINVIDDEFVENDEMLQSVVSLVAADPAITLSPANASITILNDDMVVVGFDPGFYQVNEADGFVLVRFRILSGILRIPVVVSFSTADGSAIAGAGPDGDYIAVDPFMFTFDGDTVNQEIMVQIEDNNIQEPAENFLALLATTEDSSILMLNPPSATIEIIDDDIVMFSFRQDSYTFNESSGLVTVYVDKIGDTDQTVTLMVMGPLQAETGMTIDQTITFGPSDTEMAITFMVQDDDIALEPTEMFQWALSVLSPMEDGVTVGPFNSTTISVVDDDELVLSLAKPREIPESMNSTACITFSNEFATDFMINAMPSPPENVPARATPGVDYTAPPDTLLAESGTHGPGTDLCFETPIVDDDFVEVEECFAVTISLPSPDTDDLLVSIEDGGESVTCCIQDDDTVTIGFGESMYAFSEDDGNATIFVMILDGSLMRPVTVTLSLEDISAITGDDYDNIGPISITFTENMTAFEIPLSILDDAIHELDEDLAGTLNSSEDPSVVILAPASTLITILDDDEVTFSFRQQMIMFLESIGVATVYVDKSGSTDQTITLSVTGPLQEGSSMVIDQQITFGPDDIEIQINFTVIDDFIALEPIETFVWNLELVAPVDRASVSPYNSTSIQIVDDDDLVLQLNKSGQVPEAENATACIAFSAFFATDFNINASPTMPENVTVPGIATPGEDYMAPPMDLQALAGIHGPGSDLCFQIPIVQDEFVELEECFAVSISLNDTIGLMVSIAEDEDIALCCVQDDDRVLIGFEVVDYSLDEPDGSVALLVGVLDGMLQRPVEVILFTVDGTATSIGVIDFNSLSDVALQFDENTLSIPTTVFVIDDDILENDEIFFGNLSTVDPAVDLAPSEATVTIFDLDDEITVGFDPTEYMVGETDGQVELFVVILNGTLERDVTVLFETSPGTATQADPADYDATSTLLTFEPGVDIVAVPVNIVNDTIVEGNETFFGNLDNQGQPVIIDPPRELATVLITEDVNDEVTIGFEQTLYLAEEGNVVEVCAVLLSGMLERDVVVTATSSDGTAEGGEDYVPVVDEPLVFNADSDRMCFNLTTMEDELLEDEENLLLNLETDDPMVVLAPEEAEVRINDTNRITVGLEETVYFTDEEDGAFIEVCVVTAEMVARDAVVTLATTDGTATSVGNVDFEALNIDLTFMAGVMRICTNITILNDAIYEDPEEFTVTLSTSDPAVDVDPNREMATATINDNDEIVIGFVLPAYGVFEDVPSGYVQIGVEVKNGGMLERNATVVFTTADGAGNRGAIDGEDYDSTMMVFVFSSANQDAPVFVLVPIINDTDSEGTEIFYGDLVTSENRVILEPNRTEISIFDDDTVSVGFVNDPYQAREESGFATLMIQVEGMLGADLLVNLTTEDIPGEAVADVDYTPLQSTILRFNENTLYIEVNVTLTDDDFLEGDEDFLARLDIITTNLGAELVPDDNAIVTILDDDRVVIGMEELLVSVPEDIGQRELCASIMDGQLMTEVDVMVVFEGTSAVDGEDFISESITLTFGPDVDQLCFNITIIDDDRYELREDFFVNLTTTEPLVTLMPMSTLVMIEDQDTVTIGWEFPMYEGLESNGFIEICAILTTGPDGLGNTLPLVNIITSSGTATVNADFVEATDPTRFNFQSGTATRMCANVTINPDGLFEDTEYFFANLSIASTPRVIIDPQQTMINIVDADIVTIGFDPDAYEVDEDTGVVTLVVAVLDGTLETDVTVSLATQDGEAVSPDDFNALDDVQLTFSPGVTEIRINVTINDDTIDELNELFNANLTLVTDNDRVTVDPAEAEVLINDDDVAIIGFEMTQYNTTETENATTVIEVCAILMPPPTLGRTVTVTISSTDGTAETPDDYDPVMAEFVFDADTNRQCVNVTTNGDDVVEGTEDFTISLDSNDSVILLPETAEVLIMDAGMVLVMFAQPMYTFNEEDGTVMIEIVKTGSVSEPFSVMVTGGPTTQTDVEISAIDGVNAVVEFQPGPSAPNSIFITFDLTDDEIGLEAIETFVVSLEILNLQDLVMPGMPEETIINVLDPDVVNIMFGSPNITVDEDDGEFMMCILKDRETIVPVTLTLSTSPGTATEGEDYDPANVPATVTIPANASMMCFTTDTVINDTVALEDEETFVLNAEVFDPANESRINVTDGDLDVFILDEDLVTVRFERPVYNILEAAGVVEVCLIKDAETAVPFMVDDITTADGTAMEVIDYIGGPYNVTFEEEAGNRQCIEIPLTVDSTNEETEDFTVNLNLPTADNPTVLPGDPDIATVNILDDPTEFVNDTVIGDPLFTVPILVSQEQLDAVNLTELTLCYEIHGIANQWFNLVTDECTSVNARYGEFNADLNVIDEIGVRAVDNADQCVNIRVDVGNCTAQVNDAPLGLMERYSMNGISVRRYRNRVRISVPNCNDLTLVMWVFCETRTLEDFVTGAEVTGDMIKFVVMRGLNIGHRPSHGLLGQFWNIPVSIAPYTGTLRDGSQSTGRFVVNITTSGADPEEPRSYTGWLYDLTWEFEEGPCLYVGNRQAGPIYEVQDPNDNVIENSYKDYRVDSAFSEEGYDFGIFVEERCAASSGSGVTMITN